MSSYHTSALSQVNAEIAAGRAGSEDAVKEAQQALDEAAASLQEVQTHMHEVEAKYKTRKLYGQGLAEELHRGASGSVEKTEELREVIKEVDGLSEEYRLLKDLTRPPLQDAYGKAVLELRTQQALAGIDGIMSNHEAQKYAEAAAHHVMLIVKDALKVIQHSDIQSSRLTGVVQNAKRDGLITDHHLEPYQLLGTSDYTPSGVLAYGVIYSGGQESMFNTLLDRAFSDAAAELRREREAQQEEGQDSDEEGQA